MSSPIILAIDEGTTNAKVVAVERDGQIAARCGVSVAMHHPAPGLAEQDPLALWQAVCEAITGCLRQLEAVEIAGIAISNQRESVLIWQRSDGKPLTPVVSWQDRRSEARCQQLLAQGYGELITRLTGLPVDPLFPAAKIRALLDTIPNGIQRAEQGELCIGTIDSWLNWQLTDGQAFTTDFSNASRTQLFNIYRGEWDEELLALFGIPRAALAQVRSSACKHGETRISSIAGLPPGTPILALIGDSHAALYAQRFACGNVVKATYGTGSSLMLSVPEPVAAGQLSTTLAWHDGELNYALEGNITHTGSGAAWLGKMLGASSPTELTELAQSVEGNQGVYYVPALSGLGAPWWDLQARGMLCGLTDAATPAVLARAALESVAYQIADVFFAMEQASGTRLDSLCVDGTATKNRWLMQFQADLLQRPLIIQPAAEVSALGAALLAGKVLGWWQDGQVPVSLATCGERLLPRSDQQQKMHDNYKQWLEAVARCRFQPK
ncbi:FGGY-family carbohydrate kinase [Enterobacteriaceae bacterium H20N1]|uniref:FGGY-family carbohydrate kinase n=1 Tax=Dryocola boscaweniae TaxID=2925397 RepID=A0A9X3AQY2_9ENTR|nr:FGGY-family carbohydrate kinase [Dryocola boscaweniae]MCT4703895.1 FGGY-family carbohydrate kinase [Dryocola boscaweniae]MCT4717075.1 FGGY-family carbohydrate kinase [Dryocola boscaweniae]MCT4721063.1 FGGY-family carbohydrate kinase [Dryocola boscaweniae]